jgi:hypothetical protein
MLAYNFFPVNVVFTQTLIKIMHVYVIYIYIYILQNSKL